MKKEKKDVLSGFFWKMSERTAAQVVSLVVSIILARLLSPSEYGVVSLVTVFITIANVFVTSGFGTALIQKKDADNVDFSTVFFFTLGFSVVVYIILWFAAIPIASFYEMPILKPVLRVFSVNVIVMGINSIQQAYVSREMIFKKFFCSTLIGTIASAVIGIAMAYMGFGVWALVAQTIVNNVINTITLQIIIEWKPIIVFSMKRLTSLLDYGWKLLVQGLVLQVYSSLRGLIIGKLYTAEDLAYYTKGNQFPDLISTNVDTSINSVLFPAMSKEQSSEEKVKAMARRTTRISSYVMNVMLIGFIVVAEPFICVLLTEKWLPAVPYLRISCIILLFRAPQTAILQAIKALGRSDAVLKIDFPIRIFALVVLMISAKYGVVYIALSEIVTTVLGTYLYSIMAKKIFNYGLLEILFDFGVNTLLAATMGGIVLTIGNLLSASYFITLVIQVLVGGITYIFLSVVTKNDSFIYILNTCKEIIQRK